jgi:hypothetical protein
LLVNNHGAIAITMKITMSTKAIQKIGRRRRSSHASLPSERARVEPLVSRSRSVK